VPQRSTEFQELVALITTMVGDDANVTESRFLVDANTGQQREVDIVIEREVAGHNTIVSVECNERGRPQGVAWVEEMRGKHEWLPTNLLVLVAKSGFTKSALDKASRLGIRTITPSEATPEFVGQIVNRLDRVWMKYVELQGVDRMVVWTAPTETTPKEGPVPVTPDTLLFNESGMPIGHAEKLAKAIARNMPQDTEAMRDATGDESHFELGIGDRDAVAGQPLVNGEVVCVEKRTSPDVKVLVPLTAVTIFGRVKLQVVEMQLNHGTYDRVHYADSSGQLEAADVRIVVTEPADGSQAKGTFRMRPRKDLPTPAEGDDSIPSSS
jgi:hypothetical protein